MGKRKPAYRTFVEKPEREKSLEDLSLNGKKILKSIFQKKKMEEYWISLA
jgi:hypothetical protein